MLLNLRFIVNQYYLMFPNPLKTEDSARFMFSYILMYVQTVTIIQLWTFLFDWDKTINSIYFGLNTYLDIYLCGKYLEHLLQKFNFEPYSVKRKRNMRN